VSTLRPDVLERMIARTSDHGDALSRTNLAVRLWLRRIGNRFPCDEDEFPSDEHWTLAFLVWNHIVQCFYREYGIDVVPGTAGFGYLYFCDIRRPKSVCAQADGSRLGSVTNGTISAVPEHSDDRSPLHQTLVVRRAVAAGEDPLWVIERAARIAVGGRFPRRCIGEGCRHREDGRIYRDVSQALATVLAAGLVKQASLNERDRMWFDAGPATIHRSSGELKMNGQSFSFEAWNRGDWVRALRFFADRLQT
jgi:hypothetical protein